MYIDSLDPVELTRTLIAFNTINGEGDEVECAAFLADLLEDAGFTLSFSEFDTGRTTLVAMLGDDPDFESLCFTGHIDTVPLGDAPWTYDPFAGEIVDDRLYGRGSTDMKSGVAAFVAAGIRLAKTQQIDRGVSFIITAGEEVGCLGAKHLVQSNSLLPNAGALVIAEPTSNTACFGHKGALWLRINCHGVTAHGSMPELGTNAVVAASRAAIKVDDFQFNVAPHEVLGRPTANVATMHGGRNINSVPDLATLEVDVRTLPGQSHATLIENIGSCFEHNSDIETVVDLSAMISNTEDPWFKGVVAKLRNTFGISEKVKGVPFFTDGSILKPALGDIPSIVVGPGETAMAHKTDEYCYTDNIRTSAEIYAALIEDWLRSRFPHQ